MITALDAMVARNRREPRTMPELIDTVASRLDLEGFAQKVNEAVSVQDRGSRPRLQTARSTQTAVGGVASPARVTEDVVQPPASKAVQRPRKEANRQI